MRRSKHSHALISVAIFSVVAPHNAFAGPVRRVHDVASLFQAVEDYKNHHGFNVIELTAGEYELSRPLTLSSEMSGTSVSPLIIRGAPGATVTLSGATPLPRLHWARWKGHVWRARLRRFHSQRLWFGTTELIRARYPNFDPNAELFGGVASDATSPERVKSWRNPAGGVLHALHPAKWGSEHFAILGKTSDGKLLLGPAQANNRPAPPSAKFQFVENIFEELDSPNEWYYDARTHWLYFMPQSGENPNKYEYKSSKLDSIVRVVSSSGMAHDIEIKNLRLIDTEPTVMKSSEPLLRSDWTFYREGAITVERAENIKIAGLTLEKLGGNGIVLSGHVRNVTVDGNIVRNIGGTALASVGRPDAVRSPLFAAEESQPLSVIDLAPGPKSDNYPADIVFSDNLIYDIGKIDMQAAGVEISMSARVTVDHNSIFHVPRAGINIGDGAWGGHKITNNDVFDTVRDTSDHGAFNSWGRDRYWVSDRDEADRRVEANPNLPLLDAVSPITIRHNRFQCAHGWDIDLDDGSTNFIIEDNLLLSGGIKLREGFDRTVRNNVIINNTFHPHVWFKNSGDVFEHNIVMTAYQPIRLEGWGKSIDHNLFTEARDLKAAQAAGTDVHSIASDPHFIDSAKGDYRVSDTSPALEVGFKTFAMDDFGVQDPKLKLLAARPDYPIPNLRSAPGVVEPTYSLAGLTIKSVNTLGEQSAAGLSEMAGVVILSVKPESPAGAAALKVGDVIIGVAEGLGAPGLDIPDSSSFLTAVSARKWQGAMVLIVRRNQHNMNILLDLN